MEEEEDAIILEAMTHPVSPVHEDHSSTYTLGQIKQLHLADFMCHENFVIQFNPTPLHLITGANGSGKSSIANAITLCLGAVARTTGRTSHAQSFIRKGAKFAQITLVLANEGPEAFQPDQFGKEIHIVRKIYPRQSEYKILNEFGKVISKRKDSIDDILRCLSISPDNPLCVLHQDVVKTFLLNSDPKKKYQFYMQVSQLDQIKEAYDHGICTIESLDERVNRMKQKHQGMLRELGPLLQQVKMIHLRREQEARKHIVEAELISARAHQTQQEYLALQALFEQAKTNRDDLDKSITQMNKKLQQLNQRVNDFSDEKKDIDQDVKGKNGLEDLHGFLLKRAKEIRSSIFTLTHQCQVHREAITEMELEQIDLQKQIDKCADLNEQVTEVEKRCTVLEEDIAKRRSMKDESTNQIDALMRQLEIVDQTIAVKQSSIDDLKSDLVDKQEDGECFDCTTEETWSIYGGWMGDCLKRIEQETRFHQRPIGPIGRYISCTDPRWSYAVEKHLASIMPSFICCDNHDANLLIELFSLYISDTRPTIHIQAYSERVHDVSGTLQCLERVGLLSIYHVLRIDHPTVACVLIDKKQIEATILLDDLAHGKRLWQSGGLRWKTIPGKIRSVVEGWTIDGSNLKLDKTLRIYTSDHQPAQYFSSNIRLSKSKDDVTGTRKLLDEQLEEMRELREDRKRINDDLEELKRTSAEENQRIAACIQDLEWLKSMTFIDFDRSMKDVREQLEKSFVPHGEAVEQYKRADEERQKQIQHLNELLEIDQTVMNKMDSKVHESDLLEERIYLEHSQRFHYQESITKMTQKLQLAQAQITHYELTLAQMKKTLSKNSKTFDRPERSIPEIQLELDAICHFLATHEDTHEERRQIIEDYRKKQAAAQTYKTVYERCLASIDRLRHSILKRKERLITISDQHEYLVRYKFRHLMANHKFPNSDIIIDHKREELNIVVNHRSKDLATLSGGERSTSTLCFLLALWESIYQPFRILDEIDIYMDHENRHLSLETLYESARRYSSTQHIVFTPQIVDRERWSELNVPIYQMPTPKRSWSVPEDE